MESATPESQDKKTANLLMLSIGVIAVGILCVFIELTSNKVGNGLFISCIIVVCGLSLYSILILLSSYRKLNTNTSDKSDKIIKILLTINSLINIAALVYFIVIFSKKASELIKLEVLDYIKPYLKGFLFTIIIIIIVNIFIFHYLNAVQIHTNDTVPLILFLAFFGLIECIIEVIFLNIIDKVLNNITDG
jgi:uncharacterized membrane protein